VRHPRELPDPRGRPHPGTPAEVSPRVRPPSPGHLRGRADHGFVDRAPDFIPFVKELPKDTTSQKKTKADKGAKPKAAAAAVGAAATTAATAVEKAAEQLKNTGV